MREKHSASCVVLGETSSNTAREMMGQQVQEWWDEQELGAKHW